MNWLASPWLFYGGFPFALVVTVVLYWRFGRDSVTGKTHRQVVAERSKQSFDDIRGNLEYLLRSGYDGGFYVFRFKGKERFIQFRKYIRAKGDYGLELGFPRADWSRVYFPRLVNFCQDNDIPYAIRPGMGDESMEFLYVDVGQDVDAAFRLVCGIVDDVFSIPRSTGYTVEQDAVASMGLLVDNPNLTEAERHQQFHKEFFKQKGIYLSDVKVFMISGVVLLIGGAGLFYALLWGLVWSAAGVTADWGAFESKLGGYELTIRNFQLGSMIAVSSIFLLRSMPAIRRILAVGKDNLTEEEKRKRRQRGLIVRFVVLPLLLSATVASWIHW